MSMQLMVVRVNHSHHTPVDVHLFGYSEMDGLLPNVYVAGQIKP